MKFFILSAVVALAAAQTADVYSDCNDGTKVCLGSTAVDDDPLSRDNGCLESQDCALVVTWVVDSDVNFQVLAEYQEEEDEDGTIDDGNHYVAVAFSDDDGMGDDTAIIGSTAFSGDSVAVYYNFVDGRQRGSIAVGDNTAISNGNVEILDGALLATFTRPVAFSYTAPTPDGPQEKESDLAAGEYVLASAGPLDEEGEVGYHSVRAITEQPDTP